MLRGNIYLWLCMAGFFSNADINPARSLSNTLIVNTSEERYISFSLSFVGTPLDHNIDYFTKLFHKIIHLYKPPADGPRLYFSHRLGSFVLSVSAYKLTPSGFDTQSAEALYNFLHEHNLLHEPFSLDGLVDAINTINDRAETHLIPSNDSGYSSPSASH